MNTIHSTFYYIQKKLLLINKLNYNFSKYDCGDEIWYNETQFLF